MLIKPFFLWPFLAAALDKWKQGQTKVLLRHLAITGLTIIVLVILGGIVCGWQSYVSWFTYTLPVLSHGTFKSGNLSLSFAVLRLANLLGWGYVGGPLPALARLWLTGASIGAPLLAWFFARKLQSQLRYALIIAAAALFAPIAWLHYVPFVLPVFTILLRDLTEQNTLSSSVKLGIQTH